MTPFPTPWFFESGILPKEVADLSVRLQKAAEDFDRELPPDPVLREQLREGVRAMNCYYTNLIEGSDTSLADLAAASEPETEGKKGARSAEVEEIRGHLFLQKMIDDRNLSLHERDVAFCPLEKDFILELHRDFYKYTSEDQLLLKNQKGEKSSHRIRPGCFRSEDWEEVVVGRHRPVPAEEVARHMEEFCKNYKRILKSPSAILPAIAAAHHRFSHIHPFMDGNGRVGRLLTHALFRWSGIGAEGLWSISRGLARGLKGMPKSPEYKSQLANADRLRDGDYDGRGVLSHKGLETFCIWFLEVALDQITFMREKFDLKKIESRYVKVLAEELSEEDVETGKKVVHHILKYGFLEKGDRAFVLGKVSEATARKRLSVLIEKNFLREDSENVRAPYRLCFPIEYWPRFFPGLF